MDDHDHDHDYESDHHEPFNISLITARFTPSSSPDQHHINLKFNFDFKISLFLLDQDSPTAQFVGHRDFSIVGFTGLTVPKSLFFEKTRQLLYDRTCEAVEGILSYVPLSEGRCRRLMEFAWEQVWRGVRSKTLCGHKVLDLDFLVEVEDARFVREAGMVPAADSSIRSLEKYEVGSGDATELSCCICLEDFSGEGCEALCMPCEHVFHGECIEKWLRTSHYCPLCRFELPAAADGEIDGFWPATS